MFSGALVQMPCCSSSRYISNQPQGLRPRHVALPRTRGRLQVVAVGWDPEGILAEPKGGHISRRFIAKQSAQNEELKEQMNQAREEARKELSEKREARPQPTTHAELVEYLLDTEGGEMNFEVARTRPMLTDDLFTYLKDTISNERFAKNPNEQRLQEFEALESFLGDAVKALDDVTSKAAAPAERLRKLLQAPDKRKALLDMAAANEIDQPMLDLLKQNITAASASGQEKPAEFMQKVHDAARKYLITV